MSRSTEVRSKTLASRTRRIALKAGGTLLLSVFAPAATYAAQILAVRVWPAEDYTRVTLENDTNLKTSHFIVKDPERLVVDIEGIDLNPALKSLVAKIQSNDPYIKQVRVGQNRPNVVRLVFDLKEEVKPQVFMLAPIGNYQHRLIFDLYPVNPPDPITALIEKGQWAKEPSFETAPQAEAKAEEKPEPWSKPQEARSAKSEAREEKLPQLTRMITIALDPGHGGEDPGAVGRSGSREKDVVLAIANRLKAKIETQPNMRVMLTRDADYFVPLHVCACKKHARCR